jgi:hypothetical protein
MQRKRLIANGGGKTSRSFPAPRNFTELDDTFSSYATKANKFIAVNAGETKLEAIALPPLAITDTYVVNSQASMLALPAQTGDVAVRTDINQSFILQGADPTILANWVMLLVSPSHAIGGALHTADTLTHLKSKVSAPDTLMSSDAGEIAAFAAKAVPIAADLLVIEDSADASKKKSITIGTLPAAAPAAHAFGGALHTADTLTHLKSKVSAPDTLLTSDAGEIAAFAAVSTANNLETDLIVIEDANDANKKKKMTLITLREIFFRFPEFHFIADQLRAPIASDFPVNGANFASLANDANTNSIMSRQFDPTTNEGTAIDFLMPGLSPSGLPVNIVFNLIWRAETAQVAGKFVKLAVYVRQLTDDVAVPAWSAKTALATLACTANVLWQYEIITVSLAALGLSPAKFTQIELIRDAADAGDTCTSDFNLCELRIAFN